MVKFSGTYVTYKYCDIELCMPTNNASNVTEASFYIIHQTERTEAEPPRSV